jgi:hypothetical protein
LEFQHFCLPCVDGALLFELLPQHIQLAELHLQKLGLLPGRSPMSIIWASSALISLDCLRYARDAKTAVTTANTARAMVATAVH